MLNLLLKGAAAPVTVEAGPGWVLPSDVVWLDFLNPTREEELAVEAALGLYLPTREEMAEIESSSRLYREGKGLYMTAQLLTNSQGEAPRIDPGTFVIANGRLITIRYIEPTAFKVLLERIERDPASYATGPAVFLGLLDEIIDRLADAMERAVAVAEELSERIFNQQGRTDFRALIRRLGRIQRLNSKIRESAGSFTRLLIFCEAARELRRQDGFEHLETQQRDLSSIIDHAAYLSGNITFLLDAALGMINIEQNTIIKIFSIGAVIFLPPTLIASYFGMNFTNMPMLDWAWGEIVAGGLMLLSVAGALWWFRKKGWF